MTSIDKILRTSPNLNPSSKRKLQSAQDPEETYKVVKQSVNGDAKGRSHPLVQHSVEEDDGNDGLRLPNDEDEPDDEEGRFFGGGVTRTTADVIEYIDGRDHEAYVPETIDLPWLRRVGVNLEKRISKNAEMRAKYEDDPQKYMGSEADLDADVKALSILSEHPELYEEFATQGSVGSLVSLLTHENTDIAIDTIEIINELIDEDVQAEEGQWNALVNAILDSQLLSLLVANLERLDEDIEVDRGGVYNSLGILESLGSQPIVSTKIAEEPRIMQWLLRRIQKKEVTVSQNRQYAAEILAILVQNSDTNKKVALSLDAVDVILQLLSVYRKREPTKDSDEEEYVENLFDALICLVDEEHGKAKLVEAEGVELCLIMLREGGRMSKVKTLTLLDHATGGLHGTEVCLKVVETAGLRTIFGMFMKQTDDAVTEHILGIFAGLLRSLPGNSAERIRTLAKFMEKDYEKITKLIKLREEYASRLAIMNNRINTERSGLRSEELGNMSDEWLSRRLDAGLASLQIIDVVLAWLVAEDDGARKRIGSLLSNYSKSLEDIRATIEEQLAGVERVSGKDMGAITDMYKTLLGFLK